MKTGIVYRNVRVSRLKSNDYGQWEPQAESSEHVQIAGSDSQ